MESSPTISDYVRASSKAFPAQARNVTYISDWHRKNANTLLDALLHHCQRAGAEITQDSPFAAVRKTLEGASTSSHTNFAKLSQCRAADCDECRKHALYECDCPSGRSTNCALIRDNS